MVMLLGVDQRAQGKGSRTGSHGKRGKGAGEAQGHPGFRVPSRIIEDWTAKDEKKLETGRFELMSGLCLDLSGMSWPFFCEGLASKYFQLCDLTDSCHCRAKAAMDDM